MKRETKAELKERIVELELDLVRAQIPKGHCPYAYYMTQERPEECDGCDECQERFMIQMEQRIRAKVAAL